MLNQFNVEFTKHALVKIQTRGIRKEYVLECLYSPDREKQRGNGEFESVKKLSYNQVLVVIYKKEGSNVKKVITTFKSSQVRKYLL